MADIIDTANDHAQNMLDAQLATARAQAVTKGLSRHFCVDCENVIPVERQRLGGKIRRLSCQQDHETRNRTQIRRAMP